VFAGRKILAVVPARGGSKGIPRKNLTKVGDSSLLERVAAIVRAITWIDEAVLSTDDEEIARVGADSGLKVVRRPDELATDLASSTDVWRHAWLEAEGDAGGLFDLGVLLQPTSPLRTTADVMACVQLLIDEDRDVVISISPTPSHFTPEKTVTINDRNGLIPYLDEGFTSLRQEIRPYYFVNGYCYAAVRHRIVDEMAIHGTNVGAVIVDRPVVNIDDAFDLEVAEWLLRREQRSVIPENVRDSRPGSNQP